MPLYKNRIISARNRASKSNSTTATPSSAGNTQSSASQVSSSHHSAVIPPYKLPSSSRAVAKASRTVREEEEIIEEEDVRNLESESAAEAEVEPVASVGIGDDGEDDVDEIPNTPPTPPRPSSSSSKHKQSTPKSSECPPSSSLSGPNKNTSGENGKPKQQTEVKKKTQKSSKTQRPSEPEPLPTTIPAAEKDANVVEDDNINENDNEISSPAAPSASGTGTSAPCRKRSNEAVGAPGLFKKLELAKRRKQSESGRSRPSTATGKGPQADSVLCGSSSESEPESEPIHARIRPLVVGHSDRESNAESSSIVTVVSDAGPICDPNDPDWIWFTLNVKDHPTSAPGRVASELLDAGPSAPKLLGKLIYLSLNGRGEDRSQNTFNLHEKYANVILHAVLEITNREDNNNGMVVELVNMIFVEMRHFSTEVLHSVVESAMEYMKKKDKDKEGHLPPRWIELIGKMVAVLIERGNIHHEMDIIDGTEYKKYVVVELCRLEWNTENTASLIAVFRSLPDLEESDLKMVIQQVKSCVNSFKPAAFPPIVHQLIFLAESKCTLELLGVCSEYFKNIEFSDRSSLEVKQKRNALGTVVFHFLDVARHSNALLKAALKLVRASCFNFSLVMNPFIVCIALGLTMYDHYKDLIIVPLRNSIMQTFHSIFLSKMSYWYNATSGDSEDVVTKTFKIILDSNASEIDFIFPGLRELGLGFMSSDQNQNKYPEAAKRCQELGSYLITSLVKIAPDQLPLILGKLLQCVSSKSLIQTECLATCLGMRTRQIISPAVIGRACEIIRHLPMMDSFSAGMIVKAMSPALQLSYTLLDSLMVILRKTVWKSVDARKAAAKIMVILLSNAKVVGDVPFSQFSESQRLTCSESSSQNSGQLPDSQPLCVEILSLTKRCFNQQHLIREELYLGFHSVVRRNPALCELVCNQLLSHAKQYINEVGEEDEEDMPELRLGAVVNISGASLASIHIKEELGFLVQSLGFVVVKSFRAFHAINDGAPASAVHLDRFTRRLIAAILEMTPASIELAAAQVVGDSGGSYPIEIVHYVENAFSIQILQSMEALIEFLNYENKDGDDRTLRKLFEKYKTFREAFAKKEKAPKAKAKGDKKGSKGKDKEKANKENTLDDSDSASIASGSQASSGGFKRPDAPKKLVFYHIMTLDSVLDMLQKLYYSYEFKANKNQGSLGYVRLDQEFEKLLLSVLRQKLGNFVRKEPIHERSRPAEKTWEILADIAGALWNSVLTQNTGDESGEIVLNDIVSDRLELVNQITSHLCAMNSPVCSRLIKIFGDAINDDISYDEVFPKFFLSWKAVQGWIPLHPDNETESTVHQCLFDILASFSKPLSPDVGSKIQASNVSDWLWNYISSSANKSGGPEFGLAISACDCWLAYFMKGKGYLEQPGGSQQDIMEVARAIGAQLRDDELITSDSESERLNARAKLWMIDGESAPTILCGLLTHMEIQLNHISALLGKLKFFPVESDEAAKKASDIREKCCNMITQILKVCAELIVTDFPAGTPSTTMLRVIPQIFEILTGFAEHLMELSKTKSNYSLRGFATPVNFVSKEFQKALETMIEHIDNVQRKQYEEVLKEVRSKSTKGKVTLPAAIRTQLSLEKKLIPAMIYSFEKYDQQILALSTALEKKGKRGVFLRLGMKMSGLRDFKIDHNKLIEAFEKAARPRTVQEMSTVADSTAQGEDGLNAGTAPAPARTRANKSKAKPSATKERKGRKRKPSESEEQEEVVDLTMH